jgi:hypothetical protein
MASNKGRGLPTATADDVGFDLTLYITVLEGAVAKLHSGDIRGARVRVEQALEGILGVERTSCNKSGYLPISDNPAAESTAVTIARLTRERDEALKLAYIDSEHRFPDFLWKTRVEELVPDLRAAEADRDALRAALTKHHQLHRDSRAWFACSCYAGDPCGLATALSALSVPTTQRPDSAADDDSPSFTPPQIVELAARGFVRVNRYQSSSVSADGTCCWTNLDDQLDFQAPRETCQNTATLTTCNPRGGGVCEVHKCRCSKPLADKVKVQRCL